MPCEQEYKCGPLRDLEKKVDDHENRLRPVEMDSAVIKTKLNAILWGLASIAAAIVSMAVKVLFFA